jgi:predicted alpha/beta-hydrolase family hydrolase
LTVSAVRFSPVTSGDAVRFIYAPGAGSNLDDPFGRYLCAELSREGFEAWVFQFPYMEARRRVPDSPALLESTWNAVVAEAAAASKRPLVIGGRSMGGRFASLIAAKGADIAGLVLFAYPLHPPGRPITTGRSQHFPLIHVPTLFCSGSRDAFATPEQLAEAARLIPKATLHILDGADHGFAVLKSSGRTVWADAAQSTIAFLRELDSL